MNLFIDTNVFLSFYHFTKDDLEELRKLAVLARQGKIHLLLPEQVIHEFERNRANKIAEALKGLRSQQLNFQFPQLCRDYAEFEALRHAQQEYKRVHGELLARVESDIAQRKLKADIVIQELSDLAKRIEMLPPILEKARLRIDLGNPPGKKGSLGDAVIWETLLGEVAEKEDLHFISDDNDFFSPLSNDSIDPYLAQEWCSKKKSQLHVYKEISSFFADRFPDIKLARELEKDLLIEELAGSPTFAHTHDVIRRLSQFSDFTPVQANAIVTAALTNNQVLWIAGDPDVRDFLDKVIGSIGHQIDPDNLCRLKKVLEFPF